MVVSSRPVSKTADFVVDTESDVVGVVVVVVVVVFVVVVVVVDVVVVVVVVVVVGKRCAYKS